MCMELKLLQRVDLILNNGVECNKDVLPQLVEQTTFFPGLQVIFEQSWVVAYKHVHEAPRPGMKFVFTRVLPIIRASFTFLIILAMLDYLLHPQL